MNSRFQTIVQVYFCTWTTCKGYTLHKETTIEPASMCVCLLFHPNNNDYYDDYLRHSWQNLKIKKTRELMTHNFIIELNSFNRKLILNLGNFFLGNIFIIFHKSYQLKWYRKINFYLFKIQFNLCVFFLLNSRNFDTWSSRQTFQFLVGGNMFGCKFVLFKFSNTLIQVFRIIFSECIKISDNPLDNDDSLGYGWEILNFFILL